MTRLLALFACLAAAFAIFYLGARTPAPLPPSAPPGVFSAGRAMVDIAAMAPVPHPIGSPANHRVRDYLIARMTALGLSPRLQRAESQRVRVIGGETDVAGGDVENLIGVLPGADRAAPALVLMAHYDSVPGSSGAADDITSVSSILEMVRVLKTVGVPARDVDVVFTDGEEPGLLGANAFFSEHPLARRIGFIVNLEARGGGGRTGMFETGGDNGGAIGLYRRTAARPYASSLSVFIYNHMPNSTDFTLAKHRGMAGMNYAFLGRQFDYHSPSSTVAALDQGAVQHMGDEVLGTARALAFSRVLPRRTPDAVYANLPGGALLAYPAWGGWIVLALAAGLIAVGAARAWRAGALAWRDGLFGVVASLLLPIGGALILHFLRRATGVGFGWMGYRPLLARFPLYEVAIALAAASWVLIVAATMARGRRALAGVWLGLLLTAFIVALAVQIAQPTIAFILAWPLVLGAGFAAATANGATPAPIGWAIGLVLTALALAWLAAFEHSLLQGLDAAEGVALVLWLAALVAWPLAWPPRPGRWLAFVPGLALLAGGFAVALWLNATSPWTARHPRAAEPLYVVDPASGKAWRATPLPPDPWTRSVLEADGGAIVRRAFPGVAETTWAAPARAVNESAPPITVGRGADGRVTLIAPMAADAGFLAVNLRASAVVGDVILNGRPAALLTQPGAWTHIRWQAAPEGFALSFRPVGPGALEVRAAEYLDHWPRQATPLPPMPRALMGWDRSGSTVLISEQTLKW